MQNGSYRGIHGKTEPYDSPLPTKGQEFQRFVNLREIKSLGLNKGKLQILMRRKGFSFGILDHDRNKIGLNRLYLTPIFKVKNEALLTIFFEKWVENGSVKAGFSFAAIEEPSPPGGDTGPGW